MTLATSRAQVIVEHDASLPVIHFSVSLLTGSNLDPVGLDGLTRLATRLIRRSAGGKTADAIDAYVDQIGASISADVSTTSAGFSGTVISRSFPKVVDLLADTLGRPSLPEDELALLKRETLGEISDAKDNDRSLARHWFRKKFFQGHPNGRTILGTPSSIEAITREQIESLYRKTFVSGNLLFCFAGDIDESTAERTAAKLVHAVPDGTAPEDTTEHPVMQPGRRLVIVDKPERSQTQILIGTMGTHAHDEDHIALLVANTVFGGTFTARLTQEVRAKRGWSYGAYSSLPYDRRRQAFSMWTFPKADDCAPCVALELKLLSDWVESGITKEELAWVKLYLVRSFAFSIDTCAKRAGQKLEEVLCDLPLGYYAEFIDRINAVTLEQANLAIRRWINPDNLLITVVGTESEIGKPLLEHIPNLVSSEVIPYDAD